MLRREPPSLLVMRESGGEESLSASQVIPVSLLADSFFLVQCAFCSGFKAGLWPGFSSWVVKVE